VKAYLLGLLLRDNLDLGQDGVWNHIFIGNLWFEHPEQRNDFEDALGLERAKLSEPQFYLDALRHAEKIGGMPPVTSPTPLAPRSSTAQSHSPICALAHNRQHLKRPCAVTPARC